MKTDQDASLVAMPGRQARMALPSMRSRRAVMAASLLCAVLGLPGCGQKGPLSLPPAKAPATTPATAPATQAAASSPAR